MDHRKGVVTKTILLILSLSLISCVTQRRCFEKYPPETRIDTIVKDTTIFHDTIVFYHLSSDTVFKTILDTLEVKLQQPITYRSDTLKIASKLSIAYTWLNLDNNIIQRSLKVIDKDTTLLIRLDRAIREKNRLQKIIETAVFEKEVEVCRLHIKLQFLVIGIAIGFVVAFVLLLKRKN